MTTAPPSDNETAVDQAPVGQLDGDEQQETGLTVSEEEETVSPPPVAESHQDQEKEWIAKIRAGHRECLKHSASAVLRAIDVGLILLEAKKKHRRKFGGWFRKAVEPKAGLTLRSAERYMRVARYKEEILADIKAKLEEAKATSVSQKEVEDYLAQLSVSSALAITGVSSGDTNGGPDKKRTKPKPPKSQDVLEHEHDEWLTPEDIVAAAKDALGKIECDPCSDAAHSVTDDLYYTKDDDGLSQSDWGITAFVNPGQCGDVARWVNKALAFHQQSDDFKAILLLPADFSVDWFHRLTHFPLAFLRCCDRQPTPIEPYAAVTLSLPSFAVFVAARLDDPDRTRPFVDAFSDLAHVFLPAHGS